MKKEEEPGQLVLAGQREPGLLVLVGQQTIKRKKWTSSFHLLLIHLSLWVSHVGVLGSAGHPSILYSDICY
jgi:hypothetical protein